MEKSSTTLKRKLEVVPAALSGVFYCIVGAAFLVVVIVCSLVGRLGQRDKKGCHHVE